METPQNQPENQSTQETSAKDRDSIQNLVRFLDERGYFKDADVDHPISFEEVRAFLDSLSDADRKELEVLQNAL